MHAEREIPGRKRLNYNYHRIETIVLNYVLQDFRVKACVDNYILYTSIYP